MVVMLDLRLLVLLTKVGGNDSPLRFRVTCYIKVRKVLTVALV
jgi:hypothetical protein